MVHKNRGLGRALVGFVTSVASAAAFAQCPFNVDGTGATDATRDGLLLTRYAQGLRNAQLVAGTGASPSTVATNIIANTAQLDINGNGLFDVDDAAVISRVLIGFASGSLLPTGKAGEFATRSDATAIQRYVAGGCALTTPAIIVAANRPSAIDAARFLTQSTFGASAASINAFNALAPDASVSGSVHKQKASRWIDNQITATRGPTHFSYLLARQAEVNAFNNTVPPPVTPLVFAVFSSEVMRESFWQQTLKYNDQLRQRLVFALTQIMVISSNGGVTSVYDQAGYVDMLSQNALSNPVGGFGSFRALLGGVALSSAQGNFLDHLRNDGNAVYPNENFAREILQLFSIGLTQLDDTGVPLPNSPPTYDEDTVKGFARAFTGFSYDDPNTGVNSNGVTHPYWFWSPDTITLGANILPDVTAWARPMRAYAGRHSVDAKQLLRYTTYPGAVPACTAAIAAAGNTPTLPALVRTRVSGSNNGTTSQDATDTVEKAIDNIFCHPTLGPYISKSLIRFFTTSTPTPGYVRRVTNVFNNNGSNVRGDMRAVMRAILLDDEALAPLTTLAPADQPKFGKLKEPMLRLSAILRAFDATSSSGKYKIHNINSVEFGINQGPLQSPSVFNFFHPEFSPPGPVAMRSALAPEFEITTTTSIAATANFLGGIVTRNESDSNFTQSGSASFSGTCNTDVSPPVRTDCLAWNLSDMYSLVDNTAGMIDYLNVVYAQGNLSATAISKFVAALDTAHPLTPLPANATASQIVTWQGRKRDRVKAAMWLVSQSPDFQIQR